MIDRNANTIFLKSLCLDDHQERRRFIDSECAGDPVLRTQVQSLLDASAAEDTCFPPPTPGNDGNDTSIKTVADETAGKLIGPYQLVKQIGMGGFGIVYLADQQAPVKRQVALKVIRPGRDVKEVLTRFQAERAALAMMDHPNIARALDAGATESGQPYFVMELVRGVPITDYCDRHQLGISERLALFIGVCYAIQHAHQKGIIHRDIKPSNVLVAEQEGRPIPKVIDFGVAKAMHQSLTEESFITLGAEMIGTPLYMSPEQAQGAAFDVDTRSDIYALGAVLYELLTGSTPFDKSRFHKASVEEIRRILRDEDPPKPSDRIKANGEGASEIATLRKTDPIRLSRQVSGDLDWIVMKALEKDRQRRFETASAFAADVMHYLRQEPVAARPPSTAYRFQKFARRNRIALTTAGLVAVSLVVGTTVSVNQAIRAARAEQLAEARLNESEANLQKAHQAVDKYFTSVSENQLLNVPGLQSLRTQLLESALDYYKGYADEKVSDPNLQLERIAASFRMAQVYFQINRVDESHAVMDQTLELLEKWLQENPGSDALETRMAGIFQRGRRTLYFSSRPTNEEEAIRIDKRGVATWKQLVQLHPRDSRFQKDLALLYFRLADDQLDHKLDVEALGNFERGRQIWIELLEKLPNDPDGLASLADIEEYIGSIIVVREPVQGEAAYRRALELREKLVTMFPESAEYRADLAHSHYRLGFRLYEFQRYPECEAEYRGSIEIWQQLVKEFRGYPGFKQQLGTVLGELGRLLQQHKSFDEALPFLTQGMEVSLSLAVESPESLSILGVARETCFQLMYPLANAGRREEAELAFRNGVAMNEKMAIVSPEGMQVAHGYLWTVGWYTSVGMHKESEKACRDAVRILENHLKKSPNDTDQSEFLANGYRLLGNRVQADQRIDEAEGFFRRSVELLRTFPKEYDLKFFTSSLFYDAYADFLESQGRIQESLQQRLELLSICEAKIAENGEKPLNREQLAHARTTLAAAEERAAKIPTSESADSASDPPSPE